ncbi:wax ester/triacylglycerol synthase domain-containing protein [Rhodococcus sp. TAF43]|uniref:wax ester/triacylglycerol synthase domain-containing protein n=1 Tax=unclassified Rhodococcus (in: high G+C Gram-positive bacteria) TaxID=192944 RepID=UPI000E09E627|nr:wax ester/triacylglycerol synthase domain-containing protein [Rhodococcus sp. AG1013]RDI16641.1 WS/DGAT/MGAT family acyltransferase [Rhodococcus sp. AG1013]
MRFADWLAAGTWPIPTRDAEFIYGETDGHLGHFVVVYVFDTTQYPDAELTQERAVEWVRARLGHHHMFTHRIRRVPLGLEHPHWIPVPDFDLSAHVRATTVSEPGWAPLEAPFAELLTSRMDLTRPPWELHFFTGVSGIVDQPGRLTAVALKAHHSIGDGLGVLQLVEKVFSDETCTPAPAHPARCLGARLLAKSVLGFPRQLIRFAKDVPGNRAADRALNEAEMSGAWLANAEQPGIRFNGKVSGSGAMVPITLPTTSLRRIREAVPGATVNDALLAVVGDALARYLAEKGEPHPGSLVAIVPRSVRQVEAWESANQLAIMNVDMHTDVEHPLERVARIAESSKSEKARTSHIAVRRAAAAMETVPPPMMRLFIYTRREAANLDPGHPRHQHTMISNVAFGVDSLTLNGAPAAAVFGGQPPVDGDGLRHFLAAAAGGDLTLTVMADRGMMPDTDRYVALIRASLTEFEEAAVNRTNQDPSDEIAS